MSPLAKNRGQEEPLPKRSRASTATTSRGTISTAAPLPWANGSFLADFRRDLNRDIATVTANATGQQSQQQQQRLADWIKANPAFLTGPTSASGGQTDEHADHSFAPSATATDASFNFNLTSFLLDDHLQRPRQQDKRPTKHHSLLHSSDVVGMGTGEASASDLLNDSQINHVRGELQALAARGSALAAAIGANESFDQSLSLSTMFPVPTIPPALPSAPHRNASGAPASNSGELRQHLHKNDHYTDDVNSDTNDDNNDGDDDSIFPSRPGQKIVPDHAYIGGRGFTSPEHADQAAVLFANPASRFGRRPPLFPVPALDQDQVPGHNNAMSQSSSTDQEPGSPTPLATRPSKSFSKAMQATKEATDVIPPRLPSLELDVQMGSTAALLDAVAADGPSSPPLTPRPKPKPSRQSQASQREERRGSQESTITGPPSSFLVAVQQQVRSELRPTTPPPSTQPHVAPPAATTPPPQTRPPQREAYVTNVKDRGDWDFAAGAEDDDDDDDLSHAHLLPKYPSMPRVVSTPKSKSTSAAAPPRTKGTATHRPAATADTPEFGFTRAFTRTAAATMTPASAPAPASVPSPPSPSSPPTDPLYSHPPHELAHAVNQLTAQLRDVTAARDRLLDRVKAAEDDAASARAQLANAHREAESLRGELAGVKQHLQVVDLDRERKAEAARTEAGKVDELKVQVTSLQRMVRDLGDTVKAQERRLREQEVGAGGVSPAQVLLPGIGSPPMPFAKHMVDVGIDSRPESPQAHLQTQTPTTAIASANGTVGVPSAQFRVLRETSVQTDRRARKDSASSSASSNGGTGHTRADGAEEDEDAQVRRARRKVLQAELQREMMRKLRAVAMRRLERERAAAAAAVGQAYDLDQNHHQPPYIDRPRSAPTTPVKARVRGRSMDPAPRAARLHQHDRRLDPSPRRHTESSRRKVTAPATTSTHTQINTSAGSGPSGAAATSNGKPPFILGSNPGKSYSLPVNLQRMMSLAKNHAPGLCPHCQGDPYATSHRHPVATVVAHAIPPAENSRRKLEEQQHVLHVELARLVRQSDATQDLKAKREMHPVIQRVIRRLAELDRELEEMGNHGETSQEPDAHPDDFVVSAPATTTAARDPPRPRPASVRSSAASSPAVDRKVGKGGSRVSASAQRAAERPQLRNLSLLRSSQKVQQALLMGT